MVVHELLTFCKSMDYAEWTDVESHKIKGMAKYGQGNSDRSNHHLFIKLYFILLINLYLLIFIFFTFFKLFNLLLFYSFVKKH
jgi:hypothetical protein